MSEPLTGRADSRLPITHDVRKVVAFFDSIDPDNVCDLAEALANILSLYGHNEGAVRSVQLVKSLDIPLQNLDTLFSGSVLSECKQGVDRLFIDLPALLNESGINETFP